MRTWALTALTVAASCFCAAAQAAYVDSFQGTVMLNTGTGFQPIAENTVVNPGDKIMVSPGGSVRIVYSDECFETIETGGVKTISARPSCVQGTSNSSTPGGTPGATGATGVAGLSTGTTVLIGGALIGGGVAAAFGVKESKKDPASP